MKSKVSSGTTYEDFASEIKNHRDWWVRDDKGDVIWNHEPNSMLINATVEAA